MRKYSLLLAAGLLLCACGDKDDDLNGELMLRVLTTPHTVSVTDCSAVVGAAIVGNAALVDERGVCYSLVPEFEIDEQTLRAESASVTGSSFLTSLRELDASTRYYARAYVRCGGEMVLGNQVAFTTGEPGTVALAVLSEASVSEINPTWAVAGSGVIDSGGAGLGERGICYSTTENPTVADAKVADTQSGLGAFSVRLDGLTDRTTYYVRAYAVNSAGVAYSEQASFMARFVPKQPKVVFDDEHVTDIDFTTGSITVQVTDNGGEEPSETGVYYSTDPEKIETKFAETTHTPDADGKLRVAITGLSENRTYYLRAFATNSTGTGVSDKVVRFHTAIDGGGELKYYVLPAIQAKINNVATELEFLDRNLGATRAAASINDYEAYGWMFQWGRRADGHQRVNWSSATKGVFALGTAPNSAAPANRTTADNTPYYLKGAATVDWLLSPNQASAEDYSLNYYWAAKTEDPNYATGGTNNPCPEGFKVPTALEWTAITLQAGTAKTVFELLGTPSASYVKSDGTFTGAGTDKVYLWASDSGTGEGVTNNLDEKYAGYVMFTSGKAVRAMDKAAAMSVRCIKIRK